MMCMILDASIFAILHPSIVCTIFFSFFTFERDYIHNYIIVFVLNALSRVSIFINSSFSYCYLAG